MGEKRVSASLQERVLTRKKAVKSMSVLFGKWKDEDIESVIRSIDERTGLNGRSVCVWVKDKLNDGKTLGCLSIRGKGEKRWYSFMFSSSHFDSPRFGDLKVINVIRHEYAHYVVESLNLYEVFDDRDAHGAAFKTVCGLLNVDEDWYWSDYTSSESYFLAKSLSYDIPRVNIAEQIERWGTDLPSVRRRYMLEKKLLKKFTKAHFFSKNDTVYHKTFGRGTVLDTMPTDKKQMLYIKFDDGEEHIVRNNNVSRKPVASAPGTGAKPGLPSLFTDEEISA